MSWSSKKEGYRRGERKGKGKEGRGEVGYIKKSRGGTLGPTQKGNKGYKIFLSYLYLRYFHLIKLYLPQN